MHCSGSKICSLLSPSHASCLFTDSMASGDDDDEDGHREDFEDDLSEDPVYIYQGACSHVYTN